jgi:hypothetical protein
MGSSVKTFSPSVNLEIPWVKERFFKETCTISDMNSDGGGEQHLLAETIREEHVNSVWKKERTVGTKWGTEPGRIK